MDEAPATTTQNSGPSASTPAPDAALDDGIVPGHGDGGTVLVLGGGGGRGSAQVGALRALAENHITVDAVVGTSVGAINGTVVAALGLRGAVDVLHELWRAPLAERVFQFSRVDVLRAIAARRPWLTDGVPLRRLLAAAMTRLQVERFSELRLPLHVVMTDLELGRTEVRCEGQLIDALCASAAIPGVYPPVRIGGRSFVDGGILDTLPLDIAATLSPQRIIAVDLTAERPVSTLHRWTDLLERSWALAQHHQMLAAMEQLRGRIPVTVISPLFPQYRNPLGLPDVDQLEEGAYHATSTLLEQAGDPPGCVRQGLFYLDMPLTAAPARRARRSATPQLGHVLAALAAAPGLITSPLTGTPTSERAALIGTHDSVAHLSEA